MTFSPIRKVFQGIADRRQMFRMFDRHAQRPDRGQGNAGSLYAGEWFEIGQAAHDYMFEALPPVILAVDMFALREFLTGSITSVFFTLWIDGRARYFHGYCDLADIGHGRRMREVIVERETRPVRAMTRQERVEHIWSSTHDDYRGYAGERWPATDRGKRTITVFGGQQGTTLRLLDSLTDQEISEKLPVHLRYLPDAIAALWGGGNVQLFRHGCPRRHHARTDRRRPQWRLSQSPLWPRPRAGRTTGRVAGRR